MKTTKSQERLLESVQKEKQLIDDHTQKGRLRKLKRLLVSGSQAYSVNDLLAELHVNKETLLNLIGSLTEGGMLITIHKSMVTTSLEPPAGSEIHEIKSRGGVSIMRFGVIADTHLASKYCRLDALGAMYDIFAADGIDTVFLLGNIVDGEARFNTFDLLAHGIKEQTDYLIDNFPHREGVTTKFITGDDHEGWWIQREGINIGAHFESEARAQGRTDLHYVGHMEHNIELKRPQGSAFVRLLHAGGGSSYAYSYSSQKILEAMQGGEKPTILLIGHYHKFDYTYPRGTHALQAGCFEDQTPFMRKKKLEAMLGGCSIEVHQDERGIVRSFGVRWYPFYDRSFYKGKNWKYHWTRPT
jgi:predicted phosphodiesterase